jgi:myo-inositol 2-dehydrogenase/D-chiro-inositol 1-dehydrogenase
VSALPVTSKIGLAVIGCGAIGRIRAQLAREHPAVTWLGVCDLDTDLAGALAADVKADFVTADHTELVRRPEVNAVVVATDENAHVDPILAAARQRHRMFIEKPLATDPVDSERVLRALTDAGVDAVVGYTQRFRRRFLGVREALRAARSPPSSPARS